MTEFQTIFMNDHIDSTTFYEYIPQFKDTNINYVSTDINKGSLYKNTFMKLVTLDSGNIKIAYITSFIKGDGNYAMRYLIALADKHNIILEGKPFDIKDNPKHTLDRFKSWYMRFGCISISDTEMIRYPKVNNID